MTRAERIAELAQANAQRLLIRTVWHDMPGAHAIAAVHMALIVRDSTGAYLFGDYWHCPVIRYRVHGGNVSRWQSIESDSDGDRYGWVPYRA